MIDNLPPLTPDSSRSASTVARCHHRLAARRRQMAARERRPNPRALGPGRVLVAGFCLAYLLAMAGDLLTIAARR